MAGLSDSRLSALKAPATGRVEIPDDKVQGLRVRVSSKGTKTFVLRKRQGEKLHNITLGKYGPRFCLAESIPLVDGSPKLFPTRTKAAQAERGPSGYSKAQNRFRAGVDELLDRGEGPHWTLHDIRRTVATGLQRLGVRFEVTEAVLNHVSGARGGIAGVYQRLHWKAEKRAALEAWAAEVLRLVNGSRADNVVTLHG